MMLVVIGRLGREVQSTFMLTNSYIIQCFLKKYRIFADMKILKNSKMMIWLGIYIIFVFVCHSIATYHSIIWNNGILSIGMAMLSAKHYHSQVG